MKKVDVAFYEVFKEEEKALRKALSKNICAKFTWKTIQAQKDKEPPAKIISIRTQSEIPLAWGDKILAVLSRSQGHDHLLSLYRRSKRKVVCGYLSSYCATAVAEHAILAMMVLLRKIKRQMKNFEQFRRDDITGFECKGRHVLVVGVGSVGSEIVDVAKALRMVVRGVDIDHRIKSLEYVGLQKGVRWADVIFCALPLTNRTKDLFNYNLLRRAKAGTIFINISRGEVSPLRDLKKLLDEEILGGLSLDVYPEEKFLAEYLRGHSGSKHRDNKIISNLRHRDNVVFTPHNAFNTYESLEQKAVLSAEAIKMFLKKGTFPTAIS